MNKESLINSLKTFIVEVKNLADETYNDKDKLIYEKYMTKAHAILTKVERDIPINDEVEEMDRMFGHTWLKDDKSYTKVYLKWDMFKELFTGTMQGMTVNERLSCLGLSKEFDNAVARNDEAKLRKILFKCLLDEEDIETIISKCKMTSN